MNLLFRFIYLLIFWRFRPKVEIFDECSTPFRVFPTDLDPNIHMNNGVFLSIMDLARFDLTFRSGLFQILKRKKLYPVVASQFIRYQKSLSPFQKFEVKTKILGWDERFFYLRQIFVSKNDIVAFAVVKAKFLEKGKGGIHPQILLDAINVPKNHLILPHWVKDFLSGEKEMWEEIKKEFT